jgi:hypothetical protein
VDVGVGMLLFVNEVEEVFWGRRVLILLLGVIGGGLITPFVGHFWDTTSSTCV